MRLLSLLLSAALSVHAARHRDYEAHDYYAVHLKPSTHPEGVSSHLGLHYEGPLGELEDHHVFRSTKDFGRDHVQEALQDLKWRRRKRQHAGWDQPHILDNVLLAQKQEPHKRFPLVKRTAIPPPPAGHIAYRADAEPPPLDSAVQQGLDLAKAFGIEDPIFQDQWHLYNHVQIGQDINVTGVWAQGITGKNSTVCIIDDGLDMDSDDLKDNYFAAGSYDFNDQVDDPKPRLSDDRHGTRCAGEVSAVKNNVCGVGVAWDSKIAGVRILSKVISDEDEAVAMNYAFQYTQIYSCSWGPPDDGQSMEAPGILIKRAMVTGVQKGRQGRGSIYVFALGNGAANDDNCNFDGYTNSIYSVSVGGIDRKGLHPYYSEKCSAQLVVTYSSGSGDYIHTTDVGQNTCYNNHGGTSAAGPLVAGIYALMLEVRPELTWRDMQWVTLLTAVKLDNPDEWQDTATNKSFSHQYGYGKTDAYAMVELAKTWTLVKPQAWYDSPWLHVKHPIPQGDQGLSSSFEVTEEMLKTANLEQLEHVTVTMNVQHTRRGDLSVELRSPSGVVSHIATARRNDAANSGYIDWTFMSVAHFGESGVGTWTVIVKDTNVNEHTGNFTDWRLKLYGECIDPSIAEPLPLPTIHDDDNHDDMRTSAAVGTTSIEVPTQTGDVPGNPTDHLDRPVNSKTSPASTAAEATGTAIPPPTDDDKTQPTSPPEPTSTPDTNFLPRPFPTFGVSKRTQIWIYGAATLIILFLCGLGGYWYYVRRKRRWNARDAYEFSELQHDDADDAAAPMAKKGRARRAGELYDAFAAGSEDEEEPFDLGSEDEGSEEGEGRYRDREPGVLGSDVR